MRKSLKNSQAEEDKEKRARNAFNISAATGIIFLLIIIGIIIIERGIQFNLSLVFLAITVLVAFFSAWQSRRGNSDLGILLVIGALIATVFARVFIQKGLAIPTGITNIILISTIAMYTLPPKWAGRAIGASFLASVATIIIDQYTVGIPQSTLPQTGTQIALVLAGVYIFILAGQFSKFNLQTKLITGFLFLSTVPLILLGWQTYSSSQEILRNQVDASLRESATATSSSLYRFLQDRIDMLSAEVSLPDIVDYMSLPRDEKRGSEEAIHALEALQAFSRKDSRFVVSHSLIDADGINQLDTIEVNVGASYKDQIYFIKASSTKLPYISSVEFPRKYNIPIFYISVPVLDGQGQLLGVLVATYNANILQSELEAAVENRTSGTEYSFLIDGLEFVNLAHSSRPELVHKIYRNLDSLVFAQMQQDNSLKQGTPEELIVPQLEMLDELRGMGLQKTFEAPSWENNGDIAKSAAARIPNTRWIVVASQPVSAITVLTQDQTRATVTSSAVISILAALIALIASNLFTRPILQLTRAAERISSGDFSQKTYIQSNDEMGVLGRTFDSMVGQIQSLVGSLERRVAERTADMQKATLQSEKRARELQTIAEISRYISTEKNLESLLPLITHTVSEQFGFYHVGIFLLNENKKFAVLRAANSPGGQRMLQRQHMLEVGHTGIVGNATATGVARIALDTGTDAVYFNNPDLPETRSEMALPLLARGEIIGALDVQSTEQNAFTTTDISVLSLLADQIAIAIDNVRLLEESQRALAESQSLFREYITEAWQSKSASDILGYHQTLSGGKVITKKSVEEIESVLENDPNLLSIPIQLRGQSVGTLNIRMTKSDEELTSEQISTIQSVTERLGLALESARLFEETSTRATRERLVTEITTKIRSTNDPQEMIKTAMEELKRALGAKRVEIVPQKIQP